MGTLSAFSCEWLSLIGQWIWLYSAQSERSIIKKSFFFVIESLHSTKTHSFSERERERHSKVQRWARAHPKSAERERKLFLENCCMKFKHFLPHISSIFILFSAFDVDLWNSSQKLKDCMILCLKTARILLKMSAKLSGAHFLLSASESARLSKNWAWARAVLKIFFWARAQANFLSALKLRKNVLSN